MLFSAVNIIVFRFTWQVNMMMEPGLRVFYENCQLQQALTIKLASKDSSWPIRIYTGIHNEHTESIQQEKY
jgi:hypothetical protein